MNKLAIGWAVRESNPGGGDIFRTRPERLWDPPSLLHNGQSGQRVALTTHPIQRRDEERVELYLYFPSVPLWPVARWTWLTTSCT
jgi:hypothetical protein